MHDIYRLKENLCKELEAFGKSDSISSSSLDTIDKLAHTIKNLDKILESKEMEEYSMRGGSYGYGSYEGGSNRSMRGGYSSDGYYYDDGGMSGRRGRGMNGRFVSRDGSEIAHKLREMMADAPDENTKREIQRLADKMEQM
jgi:hypothetical protein